MSIEASHILRLVEQISAGWVAGDGKQFATSFAPQAHFVAFDGNILIGPAEIAAFHQRAFDSHLRGTKLDLAIQEIRPVSPNAWLVFAQGGIKRIDGSAGELTGESAQTLLCKQEVGVTLIEAFQNTRIRPIIDKQSAQAWREFDKLWETRNQLK